ncbi:MAG: F0F1 ATP synthase subunit delta [Anaerolineae bacterium]|nr:F0F1 ATP synthase subunit delta [Anaerolineae bacterium]
MLDIDLATVAFQVFNFLVLTALLYYFLFRPVLASVNERTEKRKQALEKIEADRKAAAKLRAALDARLSNVEEEANHLLLTAREEARLEREHLIHETHAEVERILARSHLDAHQARQQYHQEFQDELLDAILEISTLVIGQVTPQGVHETLVERLNERIWEMGRSEMDRVRAFRRAMNKRAPTAYVTSALPLSPEQQGKLARTLTALADHNVQIELTIDPALAAGVRVRMGDMILDDSIAGHIAALREQVAGTLQDRLHHEPA